MDANFIQMLQDGRLTSENIQKIYHTLSEYDPSHDPLRLRVSQCATAALCFAGQLPLDETGSFLRRDLFLFLHEKIGLPLKETDVLCTMLCSIIAVGFPIFEGPADSSCAQTPEARFTLNAAYRDEVELHRRLMTALL